MQQNNFNCEVEQIVQTDSYLKLLDIPDRIYDQSEYLNHKKYLALAQALQNDDKCIEKVPESDIEIEDLVKSLNNSQLWSRDVNLFKQWKDNEKNQVENFQSNQYENNLIMENQWKPFVSQIKQNGFMMGQDDIRDGESVELQERNENLKKCLDYSINVSSMMKNLERGHDFVKQMQMKIQRSRTSVNLLESLLQKYDEFKHIKMNASNIDFYKDHYPKLEVFLHQRQQEIQLITTQPQFMKTGFPQEGKQAFYTFPVPLENKKRHSYYYEYKFRLQEYIQHTMQPLLKQLSNSQQYTLNAFQKFIKVKKEYLNLIKLFQNSYYDQIQLSQMNQIVCRVQQDLNQYQLYYHKDLEALISSCGKEPKILFEMKVKLNGSQKFIDLKRILCFGKQKEQKLKSGADVDKSMQSCDQITEDENDIQKSYENDNFDSLRVFLLLYEIFIKCKFEATYCQNNSIIGAYSTQSIQYQNLQVQTSHEDNSKIIHSTLQLSNFAEIKISLKFFVNDDVQEIEIDDDENINHTAFSSCFLQGILSSLNSKLKEPMIMQELNYIIAQQVVDQVLRNSIFPQADDFKVSKRIHSIQQFDLQLPKETEKHLNSQDSPPEFNQIEWTISNRIYQSGKNFQNGQIQPESLNKLRKDMQQVQEKSQKSTKANTDIDGGSAEEDQGGELSQKGIQSSQTLDENLENHINQPLVKNDILCQVILQKRGFNLKLIESITDDLSSVKKQACMKMFHQLYPNIKDQIHDSISTGKLNASHLSTDWINLGQDKVLVQLSAENKKMVEQQLVEERKRIRQDLEDVPNVQSYQQLKNIALIHERIRN